MSGSGAGGVAQPEGGTINTAILHNGPYATIERARVMQATFGIPEYVFASWLRARERAAADGRAFPLSLLAYRMLGVASRAAEERDAARPGPGRGAHCKVRGEDHPRSVPVVTPAGRFGSLRLAAEAHGLGYEAARYRVRCGDWRREVRS